MYLSHPIFVNMYQGVWGFTGTIGTQEDIQKLRKYYKIDTIYILLHSPSRRKDLPPVICSDITSRNEKIIDEIVNFHLKGFPILVIFKNIEELKDFKSMLLGKKDYQSFVLIFDGTDLDKSMIESKSGNKGMITLGTNFCGRGTDIKYSEEYPLHVIVSYGTAHARALWQAYGRTGRNGKAGTTRIICTKEDFRSIVNYNDDENTSKSLRIHNYKLKKQFDFFNFFRKSRPWIFNSNELSENRQSFTSADISDLRSAFINVNRITAAKCKYPIFMSVKTFLKIQLQKIYSLKNCPECIFTWFLFQRYINELIIQTWSIFIDRTTKEFYLQLPQKQNTKSFYDLFKSFFKKKYSELINTMNNKYFPKDRLTTINETFMIIHNAVVSDFKGKIMDYFPTEIDKYRYESNSESFLFFRVGFYPYEIKDKSGSRICILDGGDDDDDEEVEADTNQSIIQKIKRKMAKEKMKEINFIEDPELKYLNKNNIFSITYVIDKIFEKICKTIDEKLSNYFGLHFFIRRCLAGCEFGICVDPLFNDIKTSPSLFDVYPLFLCTVQCKSTKPLLASILLIVLVFATIIAVKIAKYLAAPGTGITDLMKSLGKQLWKTVKNKCKDIVISVIDKYSPLKIILEKIIEWLHKQILDLLHNQKDNIAIIMRFILSTLGGREYEKAADMINSKIKINPKASLLFSDLSPMADLLKIGILFILLIFALIKNFKARHELKQTAGVYQNEFEKSQQQKDHFKKKDDLEHYQSYKEIKYDIESHYKFKDIE